MPLSFSSSFLPLFLLLSIILCCALGRFFPHFSLSVFFFPFLLSSSSLAAVFASSSIIIFLLLLLLASSPITLHLLLSIFFLSFVSSSAATISSSSSSFSSSFSPFFLYSCYSFSLLLRHLHLLLLFSLLFILLSFCLLLDLLFLLHLLVCHIRLSPSTGCISLRWYLVRCFGVLTFRVHRLSGSRLFFGRSLATGFSWPLSIGRSGCCPDIGFFWPPLLQSMLFGPSGRCCLVVVRLTPLFGWLSYRRCSKAFLSSL